MKKTLFIFFGIAIVLLALVVGKNAWREQEEKAEFARVSASKLALHFDPMTVTECTVKTPQQTVELKKEQGIWRITNLYGGILADAPVFLDFLASLKQINAEERSNDPALFKQYGLADGEGFEIALKTDGKLLEDLILGYKATDKRSNFIRRKESSQVYAVSEDILTYFGYGVGVPEKKLDVDRWLDKRALTLSEPNVTAITVREGGHTSVDVLKDVTKNTWGFKAAYPFPIDGDKVKNFLQMVSGLRGYGVSSAEEADFKGSDWTATFQVKDSAPLVLRRKVKKDGTFYLGVLGRGYAIKVAAHHFENLTRTDGVFFADNILKINEARISEVRFSTMHGKKKEALLKKEVRSGEEKKTVWATSQGLVVENAKALDILQALKNIRLDTAPTSPRKGGEVLSLSVGQEKDIHSIRVWDNQVKANEPACFPVMLDKDSKVYCIQESSLKQILGVLDQLYPLDAPQGAKPLPAPSRKQEKR